MKAPSFWWRPKVSLLSCLLSPLGSFYGCLSREVYRRRCLRQVKAPHPVISVGNLVMGGAGKTPVVLSLVSLLRERGWSPIVLTRGYGGREKGPLWVNPDLHTFFDVGDEALLLVRAAPTIVSACRAEALRLGPFPDNTVWVLDDAHTHASLAKNVSWVVVRPGQGFGNGRLFPSGPLREPLQEGLARADALVWLGGGAPLPPSIPGNLTVLRASLHPTTSLPKGTKVLGFAGIGYPESFRQTLEALGLDSVGFEAFPDHYPYKGADLRRLQHRADRAGALLVTTDKDRVRLPPAFRKDVQTVALQLLWEDEAQVMGVLTSLIPALL